MLTAILCLASFFFGCGVGGAVVWHVLARLTQAALAQEDQWSQE